MIFKYWSISISIQSEEYWISISISMPKKLKYQYSVSVSFLEKSMKKQASQADLKNWGELKIVLNRLEPQNILWTIENDVNRHLFFLFLRNKKGLLLYAIICSLREIDLLFEPYESILSLVNNFSISATRKASFCLAISAA